jgi:cytochrome b6-f complex iron-sulfur subunit
MAEKKLSVAEMLAAARRADSGQQAEAKTAAEPPATPEVATPASEQPAAGLPAPAEKPAAKPKAAPAAGGRPSVADMLAAARADKSGAAPAATPPPKPAAARPAEKPAPKPAAAVEKQPIATGSKDTASILAAARKEHKPGPTSKEAVARQQPAARGEPLPTDKAKPTARAEKTKPVVPPMPAKPDYARPKPGKAEKAEVDEDRRGVLGMMLGSFLGLGFTALSATGALWTLGTARFMFPNILTEPPSQFKVGFPADFPPGTVENKFKAQFGVWVANYEYNGQRQIYALRTVCTHLGCTPNWLEGEQKFKCPCHGSGFYKDGINFEGPAPRPLERYAIRIADDGQLEIDKSKLFQEELGQWSDPASFVPV